MPLWVPQVLLGLAIAVTAASGIWLLINLRSVAGLFRSSGEITPGPGPRMASRARVITMLILFNLGWIASVAIWTWAMSEDASDVVVSDR